MGAKAYSSVFGLALLAILPTSPSLAQDYGFGAWDVSGVVNGYVNNTIINGIVNRQLRAGKAAGGQTPEALARALQDRCADGEAKDCFELGSAYYAGNGVTEDQANAAELYQQSCDGGHVEGCTVIGGLYYLGKGVEQDFSKAESLFLQACDIGDAEACTHLAHMYAMGKDVDEDRAKAVRLLQKACDLGAEERCKDAQDLKEGEIGAIIAETVSRNMDGGLLLIDRLKGNDAEASSGIAPDGGLAITPGVWAFELRDDKDEVVNAESHCISRPVFDPKDFENEEDGRTCASEVASLEGSHAIYHFACTGADDSDYGIDLTIDGDRADGSFIFLEPDDGERYLHRGQVYKLTMQRTGGC